MQALLKQAVKKIDVLVIPVFLLGFFLIRLPSLYIIPSISFLRTQLVIKIIMIAIFCYLFITIEKNDREKLLKNPVTIWLLVYFTVRSLSIFNTLNVVDFLTGYARFLTGFVVFFIIFILARKKKFIEWFFIIFFVSAIINLIADFCLYLIPQQTLSILKIFVYEPTYNIISANIDRQRVFFNSYNELVGPLIFFYFLLITKKKAINKIQKIGLILFNLGLIVAAFISSWRIRLVDYFFASFSFLTLYIFQTKKKGAIGIIIFTSFVILCITSVIVVVGQSGSVLDRGNDAWSSFTNKPIRPILWGRAMEIGLAFPITGVGFDNFANYFTDQTNNPYLFSIANTKELLSSLVYQSPHNIFFTNMAEGGLLTFVIFVVIIVLFFMHDISTLIKPKKNKIVIIIAIVQFWTLMIYGLVHPTDSTEYYFLFFGLRGMIESTV